jgi:hypothetical protein
MRALPAVRLTASNRLDCDVSVSFFSSPFFVEDWLGVGGVVHTIIISYLMIIEKWIKRFLDLPLKGSEARLRAALAARSDSV